MPEKTGQFVKKYHAAMVIATKDRTGKLKTRIASEWVKDWEAELGGPIVDEEEFRQKFQEFLKDELGFAGSANVSIEGDELRIQVEQCSICHGNEVLRSRGAVSYTHLRAHETRHDLVCRLLLEKKKKK